MSLPNEEMICLMTLMAKCHRIAKLGLDCNFGEEEELRLSAYARVRVADPSNSGEANSDPSNSGEANSKCFECMNCGQSIVDGRFSPHLEKCMGKVIIPRLHRLEIHKETLLPHTQTYFSSNSISLLSNGASGVACEEYSNGASEEP
ncbi:unnamed protein product [Malus baccata var. baccata]